MECIKTTCIRFHFLFIFIILSGCASIPPPSSKSALGQVEIKRILDNISQDNASVSSFISSGRIIFKNWAWGSESKILIIGQREPIRLKIELIHTWGRPILHILIKEGKIEALSFSENRLYSGIYSPLTLAKFIHVRPEIDQLWSILRGYPDLKPYNSFAPQDPDQFVLFDQNGKELEKISLDLETLQISSIRVPESDLKISFSEYSTEKDIPYAEKIRVDKEGVGKHFLLNHETMVFNQKIPTNIFKMKIPPGFEIIELDKIISPTPGERIMDYGP
jgi:hypothetical protein